MSQNIGSDLEPSGLTGVFICKVWLLFEEAVDLQDNIGKV